MNTLIGVCMIQRVDGLKIKNGFLISIIVTDYIIKIPIPTSMLFGHLLTSCLRHYEPESKALISYIDQGFLLIKSKEIIIMTLNLDLIKKN